MGILGANPGSFSMIGAVGKKSLAFAFACASVLAMPHKFMAQTSESQVVIVAKVVALGPLSAFSGKITLVHFDPAFALTLRIEAMLPVIDELKPLPPTPPLPP